MEKLLAACAARVAALGGKPLAVKIAPDLSPEAVDDAVDVAVAAGAAALICTNTTIERPGAVASHPLASQAGGLSGAPLRPLALEVLKRAHARARGRLALIGVGGIMTPEDAYARLRAGASLLQVYTGFIYGGPRFAAHLARGLESLLRRDGFTRIADAIGADAPR
jgi:dihydroorotate dehydrogenase